MSEPQYVAVDITLPPELGTEDDDFDILCGALFEAGAAGLEVQDSARPLVVVASFELAEDVTARVEEVLEAVGVTGAGIARRALDDIDWSTHWKQHFAPMQFGGLWVVPSWIEPPDDAQFVLRIDPSSAFGTGQHVSTGSILDRIVELRPSTPVLDVGCGTGILALAALLVGAPSAVGVDNDPEAILVSDENAEKNALAERVDFSTTPIEELDGTYDFVVANILAQPLIDMAPSLAARVAPGGRLALSGILGTQAEDVAAAYVAAGLTLERIEPRAEWVRIDLMRS
ncbi:MAG: 50S ribosomal protein L11 methyltransferase [Deltaproteobacteria bacterium]|jgi:ribosomal protein L11 methyltransferase